MKYLPPIARQALFGLLIGIPRLWAVDPIDSSPQVVEIAVNEKVLHILGEPLCRDDCPSKFETQILTQFAHEGLIYRRIRLGLIKYDTSFKHRNSKEVLDDLDAYLDLFKPTLVIYQPGNRELRVQTRKYPNYDFDTFPKTLEAIVEKLRSRKLKMILCSPIPMGTSPDTSNLTFPNDKITGWVQATRDLSKKHGIPFVDQFTGAVTWTMHNIPDKDLYPQENYIKSWDLMGSQLAFQFNQARVEVKASEIDLHLKSPEFLAELKNGHALCDELIEVHLYQLPEWVKLPDYEQQKRTGLQAVLDKLSKHDDQLRKMIPRPGVRN